MIIRTGHKVEFLPGRTGIKFQPDGDLVPVRTCLSVPKSGDVILLADHYLAGLAGIRNNLLRVDEDGIVVWAPNPPDSGSDSFVEIRFEADGLTAWTWSCFMCRIDLANGAITQMVFTK